MRTFEKEMHLLKKEKNINSPDYTFHSGQAVFNGYGTIKGEWAIIFSVTTDAYIEVLKQITDKLLKQVSCIVLVSPTLGSNCLISNYINKLNSNAEIISFSTIMVIHDGWTTDRPILFLRQRSRKKFI